MFIKKKDNNVKIMLVNDSITDFTGTFEQVVIDLSNNKIIKKEKSEIFLKNGERVQKDTLLLEELSENDNWILITTLYKPKNYIISRNYYSPKRWKHLRTSAPKVMISKSGNDSLSLTADSLALFVDLYHQEASFSDRGFIMLPGEEKKLDIISDDPGGVSVDDIRTFTLNDYLHI